MQASLGLDTSTSSKFGAAAGLAYKQNYGESVAQVGDTIKAAFQNGIVAATDSKDAIAGVVAQIETYSKISGTEAVESTRAVAQMIKTGLAKNATEAFDLLTRGQQLGINKSEDLLDTFNEYGVQLKKLGISGPQALGLMNQAIRAGARDSDIAADALKEFAIRAVDGSASSAAGFKALGLNAKQMTETFAKGGPAANAALQLVFDRLKSIKDPAAQSAAAVNLFGTQAEDLGQALLAMDPKTAAQGLGQLAGATDRANKALGSTPTAQIEAFTRTLKQGFVEILGGQVLPAITTAAGDFKSKFGPAIADAGAKLKNAIPSLTGLAALIVTQVVPGLAAAVAVLGNFGGFLAKHATTAKVFGIAIATIAAGLAVYKVSMAAVTAGTALWSNATKAYAAAQWLMNSALFASPLTWIVLAIVAVVAVIVLIATKTTWFQTIWSKAWGGIKAAAGAVVNFFKGTVVPGFTAAWNVAASIVSAVVGAIVGYIRGLVGTVAAVLGALYSAWQAIWSRFEPVIRAVWGLVSAVIGLAIKAILFVVGSQLKAIFAVWSAVWNAVSKVVSIVVGNVVKTFTSALATTRTIWNAIGNAISVVAHAIWGKISGPINTVKSGVSSAFNAAKTAAVGAFNSMYDAVSGVVSKLVSKVTGILGTIKNAFAGAGRILWDAGTSIIQGLLDGITSKIHTVTDKLKELTDLIPKVKGPIQRDRKLLTPAGAAIIDSLVAGFASRFPSVFSSLGGLTNNIANLPIRPASASGPVPMAALGAAGNGPVINVHGDNDPEATARIVGRKLANQGV
nr:phage tail tape measure protein [Kribbella sandramycini]